MSHHDGSCLHIAWTDMHTQQLTGRRLPDLLQVIRIQPNESIYLKVNNKVPGLGLNLDVQKLDLSYKTRYNKHLPDAYERLILDVINGDKRLFIRNDELEAAWDLFTPILKVTTSVMPFWACLLLSLHTRLACSISLHLNKLCVAMCAVACFTRHFCTTGHCQHMLVIMCYADKSAGP